MKQFNILVFVLMMSATAAAQAVKFSKNIGELRAKAATTTAADTGTLFQTIINGIPAEFMYVPSDASSADDGVMVVVSGNKRLKRYIADGRVNPKWFGATGDGNAYPLSTRYSTLAAVRSVYPFVTSLSQTVDYAGIQAAANHAIEKGYILFIPSGVYAINKGIILQSRDAANMSRFFNLTVEGAVHAYQGTQGSETVIRCLHNDGFAFGIQKGKGVTIRNLYLQGQNVLNYSQTQIFDDNSASFIVNGSRENKLSPHAGIVTDPFGTAAIASANRYPGFEGYYNETSVAGSTDIKIESIKANYFVNGISVSVNGTTQNGDGIIIDRCWIDFCKNAITTGSSQNRSLWVKHLKCWGNTKFVINCADFGDGTGAFPEVDGIDIAGGVKWLVKGSSFFSMASFSHVYAESLGGIGGSFSSPVNNYNFTNCTFHFNGAVLGSSRAFATIFQGGDGRFLNTQLYYYGVAANLLRMNCSRLSFIGCKMNAPVMGEQAVYINCDIASSYNLTTNYFPRVGVPESISTGMIATVRGQGYELAAPNTIDFRRRYLGNDLIAYAGLRATVSVNETAKTYSFNAGNDASRFQPGDRIVLYGPVDEFGSLNLIPAGVIRSIDQQTVTVDGLTFGMVNATGYSIYNYRPGGLTALHLGNITAGSDVIRGVISEGSADSTVKLTAGMSISHPSFPMGTYIKSVKGNTIIVSSVASATAGGAVIMPNLWSGTASSDSTDIPHVGFLVGDVIYNTFRRPSTQSITSWVCTKAGIVGSQYPPIFKAIGGNVTTPPGGNAFSPYDGKQENEAVTTTRAGTLLQTLSLPDNSTGIITVWINGQRQGSTDVYTRQFVFRVKKRSGILTLGTPADVLPAESDPGLSGSNVSVSAKGGNVVISVASGTANAIEWKATSAWVLK